MVAGPRRTVSLLRLVFCGGILGFAYYMVLSEKPSITLTKTRTVLTSTKQVVDQRKKDHTNFSVMNSTYLLSDTLLRESNGDNKSHDSANLQDILSLDEEKEEKDDSVVLGVKKPEDAKNPLEKSSSSSSHPVASAMKVTERRAIRRNTSSLVRPINWSIRVLYTEEGISEIRKTLNEIRYCTKPVPRYSSLKEAVKAHASADKFIILASVIDGGYLHMAENLYITSLKRHDIKNYLFICVEHDACEEARKRCLPVYLYRNATNKDWGGMSSASFQEKSMIKLYLVQEVLKLGYTIFLTDLDVFYFRNPVPRIKQLCGRRCDLLAQRDVGNVLNTGFMLLRPTKYTIQFYDMMLKYKKIKEFQHDQTLFNYLFPKYRDQHRKTKVVLLSVNEFPEGRNYFRIPRRFFYDSNPCAQCYEVHNNWIIGSDSKVLRFKEHLMWMVDEGDYYSDTQRKYISYENPRGFSSAEEYLTWEPKALCNAILISLVLNRTLILPRFHGNISVEAPFSAVYKAEALVRYFSNFRESSFLLHPLVPDSIKKSVSPILKIDKALTFGLGDVHQREHANAASEKLPIDTITSFEDWIISYANFSVIRFSSLYSPILMPDLTKDLSNDSGFAERIQLKAIIARWENNAVVA